MVCGGQNREERGVICGKTQVKADLILPLSQAMGRNLFGIIRDRQRLSRVTNAL
jgi:hypothetical protein